MKKRILVFPCGSEIGLEINNALRYSSYVKLYGASSISSNHGKYVYKNYIDGIPFVNDTKFISKLNYIIDKFDIDFIFPAHDSVVLKLAENYSKLHCGVIGSPLRTCRICRSKKKTYKFFKDKLVVPKVYKLDKKDLKFPVFLKPEVGQGSKKTFVTNSMEETNFCLKKDPSLMLLEYLQGEEYTIDCFTDRRGVLRFCGPRMRRRVSNGISVDTFPVSGKEFKEIADTINSALRFRGPWFFQVKTNNAGELVLMEISPRIAGTSGMHRNLGVNIALLSFFDAIDIDVKLHINKHNIEMDRALTNRFRTDLNYKHVYIDLDDTIIRNGFVDPLVIAFLYQSLNKGIKIHLLSKHGRHIRKALRKYRIESIFDTIVNIEKDEEKADQIRNRSSIFIDDSFSERENILRRWRIPVFDLSAVESLMDWRA